MKTKIKICGITNRADALLALELGADLLGFNFYEPSPRYVEPEEAAEIIAALPMDVVTVGVFVNAGVEGVAKVLKECPLKMAQLHGEENDQECQQVSELGVGVIKALRISRREDIEQVRRYSVETVLLDAFRAELYGGTGHVFDWSWIKSCADKRLFLAGGITPENIGQALAVGTYGVDLCSGIEKKGGIKDAAKIKKLFEEINRYYEQR